MVALRWLVGCAGGRMVITRAMLHYSHPLSYHLLLPHHSLLEHGASPLEIGDVDAEVDVRLVGGHLSEAGPVNRD